MLSSYLKIAWRNIIRNKVFSSVTILGLALGMASSLLIFLWIQDERSIGQYKNRSTLYRIMEREFTTGKLVVDEDTPGLLAEELKKTFPEVVRASGFSWPEEHLLSVNEKLVKQTGRYASSDWFAMYDINILAGSSSSSLDAPNSIAISKKMANMFFGGHTTAIGKPIEVDNSVSYQVTAVYEDLPANAPEQYEYLINWTEFMRMNPWVKEWTNGGPRTRIQLRSKSDAAQFDKKLKWFLKGRNTDFSKSFYINLFLHPEKDAYLYSDFKNGYLQGGRIQYVQLLSIVAVFLIFIAGINFTNLATARSIKRAKEIGVRKVAGAGRQSLIGQFMTETFVITLFALLAAIGIVMYSIPFFNELTGKNLSLDMSSPSMWAALFGMFVLTGVLAGSYPAFFLSSLKPVKVLKGVLRFGTGAKIFRRGLVTFQFVMSMLLIVGTIVVYQQLQFIKTKNLGYDRENLIRVNMEGEIAFKYPAFKQQITGMPGIQSITHATLNLIYNGSTTESVSWPGQDPNATISFNQASVGYDFSKVMKLEFLMGRDFSPSFGMDTANYIVNETALKRIGYDEPIGKPLTFWNVPGTIIGVVKDFHYNSLHAPITPLIIRLGENHGYGNILIRTQPGKTRDALKSIESVYTAMNPKYPFTYSFVDAQFGEQYKSETIVGYLAGIFSFLAIFIACLGLFGLATFTNEQRIKEIGVRKVLGASVSSIISLLSKDYLKLIVLAIIIATPISWWAMHQWLHTFAYKTEVKWWVFGISGLLAVCIALLTISFQSVKAALINPARSLRSE